MTARTSIFSCALAAFSAFSASVPQTSADKYYFTVPDHPGGIKGVVMGDPPAYRVPRSEDYSWIKEAYAERNALRSGATLNVTSNLVAEFGQWPMSATNGLEGWTTALFSDNGAIETNVVAKYTLSDSEIPNNLMRGVYPTYGSLVPPSVGEPTLDFGRPAAFLRPEPYLWSDRTVVLSNDFPTVTEIITSTITNWTGRYYEKGEWHDSVRTNISYITKELNNGHQSIHTNMWVEILPHVETKVVTNILIKSQLGMMFRSGIVEFYDPPEQEVSGGPLRTEFITQNYGPLRDATVFAAECVNLTTNKITRTSRIWSERSPDSQYDYDETTTTNIYMYTIWPQKSMEAEKVTSKSFVIEGETDPETGEFHETGTKIETSSRDDGSITDDTVGSSGINRRFMVFLPTATVHVGGIDGRIDYVEAYVWAAAAWSRQWHVDGTGSDDSGSDYKEALVATKIGRALGSGSAEYAYGSSTNRYECFSVNIPVGSLLDDAMAATGKSFPIKPKVQLERPCPDPNRDHQAAESWATETFGSGIHSIILVIHINPWTSLPGW